MPYFAVKDANGDIIYVAATGAGTTGDPYVPTRTFTNSIPAGTAVIGKVDQGTGGASAWKVDGSGVTQPVSAASLPLPTGAATAANQTTANASLSSIDGKLPAQGQALAAASLPVVLPAAQLTILTPPAAITGFATETTLAALHAKVPASPAAEHTTAASPHAARLSDGGAFYKATTPSDTQPVSAASLPLPTGAATEATLASVLTQSNFDTKVGSLTETAPATDTASSGSNGRLQRIAQNITSLIAKLPSALGQTTKSASLSVTLASDYQAPVLPANSAPAWTNITALNGDGVAAMDATNYRSGGLQLTGTWSATVNVQISLDGGTTWVSLRLANQTGGVFTSGVTTNNIYMFAVPPGAQLRVRATSFSSGTIVGALALSSLVSLDTFQYSSISGTLSVPPTVSGTLGDGAANNRPIQAADTGIAYYPSLQYASNGATWDRVRAVATFVDLNAVSITSIATVWTPTSGKKFRLMGGSISVSSACSVLFEDNAAGTTIHRTPQLLANTPYYFSLGNGKLSAAANNVLKATASTGTVTVSGTLFGTEE